MYLAKEKEGSNGNSNGKTQMMLNYMGHSQVKRCWTGLKMATLKMESLSGKLTPMHSSTAPGE